MCFNPIFHTGPEFVIFRPRTMGTKLANSIFQINMVSFERSVSKHSENLSFRWRIQCTCIKNTKQGGTMQLL